MAEEGINALMLQMMKQVKGDRCADHREFLQLVMLERRRARVSKGANTERSN